MKTKKRFIPMIMLVQMLVVVCVGTAFAGSWIDRMKGIETGWHTGGVANTADGGHALYARQSGYFENVFAVLTKIDNLGDPQWSTSYVQGVASGFDTTADGGYLVTAYLAEYAGEGCWVAKLDQDGNITGERHLHMPGDWLVQTSGNSAYVVGGGSYGTSITKFNTNTFAVEWEGVLSYLNYTISPHAIEVDANGNLFIIGRVDGGTNGVDAFVAKVSSQGVVLALKVLSSPVSDWAYGIALIGSDGSVVLSGNLRNATTGDDVWVAKLDPNLNFVWQGAFAGPGTGADWSGNVTALADGTITIGAASSGFSPNGNWDIWGIRLQDKANPTVKWQKRYATLFGEESYALTATPDGGMLISSSLYDIDGPGGSIFFKSDVNGDIAAHDASGASITNPYVFNTSSTMYNTNLVVIDALASTSLTSQGFSFSNPATPTTPAPFGLTWEKMSQ